MRHERDRSTRVGAVSRRWRLSGSTEEQHYFDEGEKTICLTSIEDTAFVDCGHGSSSWNDDSDSVLSYSWSSGGVVLAYDDERGTWMEQDLGSEATPSASVLPLPSLSPPLAKLKALARVQRAAEAWYMPFAVRRVWAD
jgi:hypothetical protein